MNWELTLLQSRFLISIKWSHFLFCFHSQIVCSHFTFGCIHKQCCRQRVERGVLGDTTFHTSILSLIYHAILSARFAIANPTRYVSSKMHWLFLGQTVFFPSSRWNSDTKIICDQQNKSKVPSWLIRTPHPACPISSPTRSPRTLPLTGATSTLSPSSLTCLWMIWQLQTQRQLLQCQVAMTIA